MGKVLAIYGAGGLGREVLELAKIINDKEKRWDGFIFIVDGGGNGDSVEGLDVYDYPEAVKNFKSDMEVSLAIGEPAIRLKIFFKLMKDEVTLATLIHPNVHIPESTTVGTGVTINEGCHISVGIKISDWCYLQPMAGIGHDCVIGRNCIISANVMVCGNVHIGDNTYIAPGVPIKQKINIGKDVIIGMGAVVQMDIEDNVIALGNPARGMKHKDDSRALK